MNKNTESLDLTAKILTTEYEKHAEDNNIMLNPDSKFVNTMINILIKNEEKYGPGKYYCPCRPITMDQELNQKIICPCEFHIDEIKQKGKCHCGLFVSKK